MVLAVVLRALLLLQLLISPLLASDPCTSYKPVPHIDKRDGQYQISRGERYLSDRFLLTGWYGTPDSRTLLASAPGFQHCGSLYPIWRKQIMKDKSVMCIQHPRNKCYRKFTIDTRLCGGKEIFKLTRSRIHRSAYCFGWALDDIPPEFNVKPSVETKLEHLDFDRSELSFLCRFTKHVDDVFYSTSWLVDGDTVLRRGERQWKGGTVMEHHRLTEGDLKAENITHYGIQIGCSVRASNGVGKASRAPILSDWEFVGFKVPQTSIVLKEGESADIPLELTAPFGCGNFTDEFCLLLVEVQTIENPNDCQTAAMVSSFCGIEVSALSLQGLTPLTVFGRVTDRYETSNKVVNLKLKTTVEHEHTMWANNDIGNIQIQLLKDSTVVEGKSCYATNDPHMKTFDGRRYEHQYDGIFTMYKHKTLPIEVQLQTTYCGYGRYNAWCNCGVAVRAGRTVFEFNRCGGQSDIWTLEYTLCEDGGDVLQVKRNGRNYEVYLPTGGKVEVNVYSVFLNLYIYPSVQDVGTSLGLCGRLSPDGACNDDFIMRDGSYSTDPTARSNCNERYRVWQNLLTGFSESWRVHDDDNLFDLSKHDRLTPWPKQNTFCSCPEKDEFIDRPIKEVVCTAGEAHSTCKKLPGFTDVPPTKCSIKNRRKRRAAKSVRIPRVRREASNTWSNGWTEDLARAHCAGVFQGSKSVQVCNGVKGVETTESTENCMLDIQLTSTADFSEFSVDTVRSKCLREVAVNPVLQDTGNSPTNRSVFDLVIAEACPNDCSGYGQCSEGTCTCEGDYGGVDCSVDLTAAPVVAEVENDGHCDTSRDECHMISLYGETFTDSRSTCFVEEFKATRKGMEHQGPVRSQAHVLSISQIKCEFTSTINNTGSDETDYVRAYRISVSNNGANFSDSVGLMVYDSTCFTAYLNETDFSWIMDESYCVYREVCVANGTSRPDDRCKLCQVTEAAKTWRNNTGDGCVPTAPPSTSGTSPQASDGHPSGTPLGTGTISDSTILTTETTTEQAVTSAPLNQDDLVQSSSKSLASSDERRIKPTSVVEAIPRATSDVTSLPVEHEPETVKSSELLAGMTSTEPVLRATPTLKAPSLVESTLMSSKKMAVQSEEFTVSSMSIMSLSETMVSTAAEHTPSQDIDPSIKEDVSEQLPSASSTLAIMASKVERMLTSKQAINLTSMVTEGHIHRSSTGKGIYQTTEATRRETQGRSSDQNLDRTTEASTTDSRRSSYEKGLERTTKHPEQNTQQSSTDKGIGHTTEAAERETQRSSADKGLDRTREPSERNTKQSTTVKEINPTRPTSEEDKRQSTSDIGKDKITEATDKGRERDPSDKGLGLTSLLSIVGGVVGVVALAVAGLFYVRSRRRQAYVGNL